MDHDKLRVISMGWGVQSWTIAAMVALGHRARIPLTQAVNIPEDHGLIQNGLFDAECDSGYCFL